MTNKIRIAYLIDTISSDKAGTEKQLLNIIERLDMEKFEVTLICLYASHWMQRNRLPCDVVNLNYRGFLKPDFPAVLWNYLRVLKARDIELVQTFFEDSMFVGCLGKTLSRRGHALIVSKRDLGLGSDEPSYHCLYKRLRPFVFRAVDGIAVNAYAIKSWVSRHEKVPSENITVIGNGIDLPSFPPALPALFSEFQADTWIGIVANLKPIKRIDLLLHALAHLKESGTKEVVRLVIMGDGRLKSDLAQLAKNVGIGDRIHFIGAVDNVSDYLFGLDIGVLCSDKEGLSNAILEYMACGIPVIATDAGGNSELVDGTNGVCVPAGDYLSLAQALEKLIKSPPLRKEMGEYSKEKVRQKFNWDRIIPQWESYYASIVGGLANSRKAMGKVHVET